DYTATVALNDTANFEWKDGTITPLNFSWSIAKATPTVSVTSINDVVYGTIGNTEYDFTTVKDGVTTKNYIYTATGVGSDSTSLAGTIAVTYTAKSGETSTAEKLKVGAYTASWTFTPNNTTNYESVSGTQPFNVTPIAIAPTIKTAGATAIEKVYDKTADATVVAGDVVLGGLIFSDDVALTFTATYDNKNVGANKAVTVHY
ncbi:MAG: YDG domain-containing protein, partial [Clostridia bacterium]